MQMKYPNTFKVVTAEDYDHSKDAPVIDAELLWIEDHIPHYEIDYNLSRQEKYSKYVGQNMYLENLKDPENCYYVYSCYFNVENPGQNLYWYSFPNIPEVDTKQLTKRKYKFICLQSKPRMHRIITSSWLNENFNKEEFYYTINFNVEQEGIAVHLQFIDDLYPGLPVHFIEEVDYSNKIANDLSVDKFYRLFYPYSSNAIFNIVTEPEFFIHGYHHSEKTDQAFLSYNIPIVHGYSACDSIKKIGFDMFEDIVNYSSQYIKDPFERTFRLLNDNKEILKNAHDILTTEVMQRLEYNNKLIRNKDINNDLLYKLNDKSNIELFKEIAYNTTNKELYQQLRFLF